MIFLTKIKKFLEGYDFEYDKSHETLYAYTNYFIEKFNEHKWKWVKEYSKMGEANKVDFSVIKGGIENLNNNMFCGKEIYKNIISRIGVNNTYYYGFNYLGVQYNLYFFSKKPPSEKFLSKLVIITNLLTEECPENKRPETITVLFCDTQFKKNLPMENGNIKPGETIGGFHVNSGSTSFVSTKKRIINIWRREERIKVYIHELLHALNVETEVLNDVFLVDPLMKHFNVDIPILLLNEAYVEMYATFLNIIVHYELSSSKLNFIKKSGKPLKKSKMVKDETIINAFSKQVSFSTFQVAKLLYYYGYRSVSDIYSNKCKFRRKARWDEDSNVFSYYIIKWSLLSNICKVFELCDNRNKIFCNIDKKNLDVFMELCLRSWKKRKFTKVINTHIKEMIDTRKSYPHIGITLRMTIHD